MGSTLSCTHCGIHSVILSLAHCHTNLLNITFQISETFTDFSSEILLEKTPSQLTSMLCSLDTNIKLTLVNSTFSEHACTDPLSPFASFWHEGLSWRFSQVYVIQKSDHGGPCQYDLLPLYSLDTPPMFHSKTHNTVTFPLLHIACYPPGQRSQQTMGHDSAPHGQGSRKGQERWEVWWHCPAQRLLCHALSGDLPIKQQFATSSYSLRTATDNEERRARKINMTKSLFICIHSEHIPSASRLGKCHHTSLKKYKPHLKRTILFLRAILFPDNSKAKRAYHRRPLLPHSVWRSWRWETCARAMPCTDQAALGNSLCQPEYRSNKTN